VTNDGWFGTSTGPYQHLAQARLRAVEQGLALVRSANTGISAVIDPYGHYVVKTELGDSRAVVSELPRPLSVTAYGRWGDLVFAILCGAASLFSIAFARKLR
jgi:apolipoprotein N-acyltransferase